MPGIFLGQREKNSGLRRFPSTLAQISSGWEGVKMTKTLWSCGKDEAVWEIVCEGTHPAQSST